MPGEFPYTSGLYPFKRTGEDPTRMFAGEGGPERTNRRFHYVSLGMPAKRLSTAFDSCNAYTEMTQTIVQIFMERLVMQVYLFAVWMMLKNYILDLILADPMTSVSMTINGPAPMLLGFFMNAAIDQQCELYIKENGLEKEVEAKIAAIYEGKERPKYNGEIPEGNDGLGLMLLGVTGDQVLPKDSLRGYQNQNYCSS